MTPEKSPALPANTLAFAGFINKNAQFPSWLQTGVWCWSLVKARSPLVMIWASLMGVFVCSAVLGLSGLINFGMMTVLCALMSWMTGASAAYLVSQQKSTPPEGTLWEWGWLSEVGAAPRSYRGVWRHVLMVGNLNGLWIAVGAMILLGAVYVNFINEWAYLSEPLIWATGVWGLVAGVVVMWGGAIAGPLISLHNQGIRRSTILVLKAMLMHPIGSTLLGLGWMVFVVLCALSGAVGDEPVIAVLIALLVPVLGLVLSAHTVGYYKALYLQPQEWIEEKLASGTK